MDGLSEEVGAVLAFVTFCFDEQCSSGSLPVDEGGFARVMVVEFDGATVTVGAEDGTSGNVFHPGSLGLMKGASAQYFEVSIIHIGHRRDTSLHAHLVFQRIVLWLAALLTAHPPILMKSRK